MGLFSNSSFGIEYIRTRFHNEKSDISNVTLQQPTKTKGDDWTEFPINPNLGRPNRDKRTEFPINRNLG